MTLDRCQLICLMRSVSRSAIARAAVVLWLGVVQETCCKRAPIIIFQGVGREVCGRQWAGRVPVETQRRVFAVIAAATAAAIAAAFATAAAPVMRGPKCDTVQIGVFSGFLLSVTN